MTRPGIINHFTGLITGTLLCLAVASALSNEAALARGGKIAPSRGVKLKLEEDVKQDWTRMTGSCQPQAWFSTVPHEFAPGCGAVATLPLSPADVNGDGIQEIFVGGTASIASGVPITSTPGTGMLLWSKIEMTAEGAAPAQISTAELDIDFATAWILLLPDFGFSSENATCEWRIVANPTGWIDVDTDGDLDLVVQIVVDRHTTYAFWHDPCAGMMCPCPPDDPWGGGGMGMCPCKPCPSKQWVDQGWQRYGTSTIWLENVGFQRSEPSNAYDLDHNGSVDTADLSLLLLNFSN